MPTLGRALELLLEQTRHRVRQGIRSAFTLHMQESHAKFLIAELGADRPLVEINHQLAFELGERLGARLSMRTVAKRLSTLRRALRLAVGRGELAEVALPPFTPRVRILRTFAEYRRLCAALPQRRADWISVALWTCQRPGDVERMCWSDIDVAVRPGAPSMLIRSTKTRKPVPIRVKIPRPLVQVLESRLERLTAAGTPPRGSDRLVDPWPGVSRTLPLVCVRIGLPPMSALDMRHSGISWMVRRTGLTVAAQRWGGWGSLAMMQIHYAHALPAQLAEAADELGSIADEDPTNDNDGQGGPKVREIPTSASRLQHACATSPSDFRLWYLSHLVPWHPASASRVGVWMTTQVWSRTTSLNSTTRFRGVALVKRGRPAPWQAFIGVEGHGRNLGQFGTEEEAARAYDAAALRFFGETAPLVLNFPDAAPAAPTERLVRTSRGEGSVS